jgi:hypothetical protein
MDLELIATSRYQTKSGGLVNYKFPCSAKYFVRNIQGDLRKERQRAQAGAAPRGDLANEFLRHELP